MIEKLSPAVLRAHKGISFVGISTAFFCHDGKGKLFLAQRSHNARDERGTWDSGGGGLKWGVKLEANVRREILEEYGATAHDLEFLGYREVFRRSNDGEQTHWLAFDYVARVEAHEVTIKEPAMADDSGWFALDSLPKPLHSQLAGTIRKYASEWPRILGSAPPGKP